MLLIYIFIWLAPWNEGYSQGGLLHFRDHFKDAGGNIRKGEEIAIELRIVDGFGFNVLKERHVILTNEEGLGICWLGKGTTLAGQLKGITWERGGYSLEVIQIDKQIKKVWSVDGVIYSQYLIHTPALRKKQGTVDYGDDRGILYWGRQQGRLLGISAEGVVLSIVDEGGGKWKPNRVPSISGMTKAVYLGQGEIKMESYGISEELKIRKGFVWDTVSNVGLPGLGRWEEEKEIGSYEARIKGFEPDKMYFIRSYISTSEGTSYGPETMIKTFKALPVLETLLQDTNIITGVGMGGKIVSDGGMALRDRGVAWSTSPNPTIDLPTRMTMTPENMETRDYTSTVKDLQPNTTYYVRAYATNSAGTGYGNEVLFTTSSILLANLPVLTTTVPGSITTSTANSGGVISSDGGAPITARGVVWSTTPKPAITLTTKTMDKTGSGTFTSVMSFLSSNTKYYVRAYATNSAGTAYGEDREFTTLKVRRQTKPVVSTVIPSEVTASTARSGGKVSVDGGSSVTARGVVWSTKRSPTIAQETKTVDGAGLGDFISNLPNLASNTKYYVRAYATNGTGTEYGGRESFTTGGSSSAGLPVLSTTGVTLVTSNAAQGGGNISADGGKAVTARGIIWSTSPKPLVTLTTKTNDGPGTGTFTSKMSGLAVNTKYYVVAYATNANGTVYGLETNFTTLISEPVPAGPCPEVASVQDVDGNSYNTIQIGKQCWLKENLRVTKYGDGSLIPLDETGGTIGNATGQTWGSGKTGARTVYNNNTANVGLYGYLYNWYAATDSKGLCPQGWRVATDAEWTTLTNYLGGELVAGSKMKSTGTTQWQSTNNLVKNESGFMALPGGYRNNDGRFYSIRTDAFFWTSTAFSENNAWYRYMTDIKGQVYKNNRFVKSVGASVRCIKEVSTSSIPILTTALVQTVTSTTALGGGNVTSQGVSAVTARGVVWSTSPNPTIALATKTVNGTGTEAFTSNLTGLAPNTTYYIKAYATNSAGTGYGAETSFKTTSLTINLIPSITTSAMSAITPTTVNGGGNVTSDGGAAITARGVVWSTNPNPTIALATKTNNGTGIGSFTSSLMGLTPNTTYYIKSYATNNVGTGYGSELSFKTTGQSISMPSVLTGVVSAITTTTTSSGGSVSNDGGSAVTERGVIWSTSPNPTIALTTKSSDGVGTGAFTSSLTGLTPNTTYYIRAYATNSVGTGYGNELTFTTLPKLTTTEVTEKTENSAKSGGNITPAGNAEITARGVVWSTSPNPTIALTTKTSDDKGPGVFTSSVTGLTAKTRYYLRAYATNGTGTNYGNEISFIAEKDPSSCIGSPTVTDINSNVYPTVQIGTQCWMQSNLKVSKYRNGDTIPTGLSDGEWSRTTSGAYAIYNINNANDAIYGSLYNWHSVADNRGLCPTGWHVPTDNEWTILTTYLGGEKNAGGKMKSVGTAYWADPNIGATNESGFSAHGGSWVYNAGYFYPVSLYGRLFAHFWSATELDGLIAWARLLSYTSGSLDRLSHPKSFGNSVRCLRDTASAVPTLTTSAISSITSTTATGGGNITTDGGAPVTMRGVVWSTSPIPTISLSTKTSNGVGTGSFASSLTGLAPNTTYYARAYATNSAGTTYGNELSFKTTAASAVPTLTTSAISSITSTTATGGGNITTDGGAPVIVRGVVWSTSPGSTVTLSTKTIDGTGLGSFTSNLTGLVANTTYYARAYATNSSGTGYGQELNFVAKKDSGCIGTQTVKDIDGNTYKTVQIGTQCWMQSNLKVSKYRNGVAIPTGLSDTAWLNTTSGAYAIYDNNNANDAIYGKLYNWYAVNDSIGLCPNGWHVPTDSEWLILLTYLRDPVGGKMKSVGTAYWNEPNIGATNESGFSGLPGGCRDTFGKFQNIRNIAYFQIAGDSVYFRAGFHSLYSYNDRDFRSYDYYGNNTLGSSVRCLKD